MMKTGNIYPYPIILLITAFGLVSCATEWGKDYFQTEKEVNALLNSKDFDKARASIRGRGAMCTYPSDTSYCSAIDKNAETKLTAQIDHAEACSKVLDDLMSKAAPITKLEASKTQKALQDACNRNEMPESWVGRYDSIEKSVLVAQSTGKFEEKTPNGTIDQVAVAKNKCMAGMRWRYGYADAPKEGKVVSGLIAFRIHPDGLRGEFTQFDKCEEARLTDKEAFRQLGTEKCLLRYVGKNVVIKLAKIDLMFGSKDSLQKFTVYFSDKSKCEGARSNGFDGHFQMFATDLSKIAPVGSDAIPRFIGECTEFEKNVCGDNYETTYEDVSLVE